MENLLFEKVTIKRRVVGAEDSNGNPTYTHTTILTDEPCRTYSKFYNEVVEGQLIIKEINKVAIAYKGIKVDEGDILIFSGVNYEVVKAYTRYAGSIPHHLEIEVKIIKSEAVGA
jgi:tetrahydromethanopterin S-methyltransferase subunit H